MGLFGGQKKTKEAIKNNANLMLLMDSFVYEIQRR